MNIQNLNVLVVDDHELILEGITKYLQSIGVDQVETASDANTLFNELSRHKYDMLLLDIRIGSDDARLFIADIKKKYPTLTIIVISSHESKEVIEPLLDIGVNGFVGKSLPLSHLKDALIETSKGSLYLDPNTAKMMEKEGRTKNTIYLTRREKEVLRETLKEKSIKEIAKSLFLTEKTIESHRSNLFTKFDVKNVTGLVKKAMLLGYHLEE